MEGKGFQALVGRLGDLTAVQREVLIAALKRKLPSNEALKLIEMRFDANPACGHCGSEHVGGWSSANGMKALSLRRLRVHLQRADRHTASPAASS
jgi:hypothetical protein